MAMMESLEGELAFKNLDQQIQLSVLCPGLVASGIWDVEKSESQRDAADNRGVRAKESQRQFFETAGTSTFDTIDEFLRGVARGQFICDSVEGQVIFWQAGPATSLAAACPPNFGARCDNGAHIRKTQRHHPCPGSLPEPLDESVDPSSS